MLAMRKLALLALLIITGPIQAQFAYVCGMPAEMVCCEGHGIDMAVSPDCAMQADGGELSECMELADADTDAQSTRSASTSFDRGIDKTPPTLTAILPIAFELTAARFSSHSLPHSLAPPGAAGTQTYLVTRRLRI